MGYFCHTSLHMATNLRKVAYILKGCALTIMNIQDKTVFQ